MRHLAIAIFIGLTCILMLSSSVYADPTLPLPRMPIGGDQDGSEQPFVLHSPDYELIADVQNFRVPGSGEFDISFDFVFREASYNSEFGFFPVDNPSGEIGGVSPGDEGYLETALERAKIIFPSGSTAYTPDITATVTGGDILVFFIVKTAL